MSTYLPNYLVTKGDYMKTMNVTFEDKEYRELLKKKKNKSWHDFIIKNGSEQKIKQGEE